MVRMARMSTKKLGELLMEAGLIDQAKLDQALSQQKGAGERLGESLIRLGWITERDIARTVATQFALPYLAVSQYFIPKEVLRLIPLRELSEHRCMPLDRFGNLLTMAIAGPVDPAARERMEKGSGCEISLYVSTASEIEGALAKGFPDEAKKGEDPS